MAVYMDAQSKKSFGVGPRNGKNISGGCATGGVHWREVLPSLFLFLNAISTLQFRGREDCLIHISASGSGADAADFSGCCEVYAFEVASLFGTQSVSGPEYRSTLAL